MAAFMTRRVRLICKYLVRKQERKENLGNLEVGVRSKKCLGM